MAIASGDLKEMIDRHSRNEMIDMRCQNESTKNSGASGKECVCANTHGYVYIVTLVECSAEMLTIKDFTHQLPKSCVL